MSIQNLPLQLQKEIMELEIEFVRGGLTNLMVQKTILEGMNAQKTRSRIS